MGLPDMKLPIQYALGFSGKIPNRFGRYDLKNPMRLRLKS
jgi:1-deoxy-D-xylulose 5-phosphate reductoisomerase